MQRVREVQAGPVGRPEALPVREAPAVQVDQPRAPEELVPTRGAAVPGVRRALPPMRARLAMRRAVGKTAAPAP
jgi:hypothetical protein